MNVLPQHEGGGDEPYSSVNRVHVYTSVEDSTNNSKLLNGVLIDNHFTHCCMDSLIAKRRENGIIATAVFGISLAGKQEDTGVIYYNLNNNYKAWFYSQSVLMEYNWM